MQPQAGRTALVTGGTRGIGRAIAERLIRDGARVIVTGTRPEGSAPDGVEYIGADLCDDTELDRLVAAIAAQPIHILVNNAGINKINPFTDIDLGDFDRIQRVNVRAPLRLCQAVLPFMTANGWGRIVNIGSVFGVISKEERASYSASKCALSGLTTALAVEVAPRGVLANVVAPGFIATDMTRQILGAEGMARMAALVPMKRMGEPSEVAALVSWLASPDNSYVCGQTFVIDGGFTRI